MEKNNKILEKLDWEKIYEYVEDGMLHAHKHPEYDIWLVKYSKRTHAEGLWNEYTLACRGIVIDKEGNILSRPFGKFKNFEEHNSEDLNWNQNFEVFEKVDGSLVTMFYYKEKEEWITTSSGSFNSYVTDEVKKMFDTDALDHMDKNCTYIFEIIF